MKNFKILIYMLFHFKCISTMSGKAVILTYRDKKYLFNCFEGLQRYFMEININFRKIEVFLLPTQNSIIPFANVYLNIPTENHKKIKILTKYKDILNEMEEQFDYIKIKEDSFVNEIDDQNCKIIEIDCDDLKFYIISFKIIDGHIDSEKVGREGIPMEYCKQLVEKRNIKFNDETFLREDFVEDDFKPEPFCILINAQSIKQIDDIIKKYNVRNFVLFEKNIVEQIQKFKYEGIQFYFIEDRNTIEYIEQYEYIIKLSKFNKNYHLPVIPQKWFETKSESDNVIILKNMGIIEYDQKNKKFLHHQQKIGEVKAEVTNRKFTKDGLIFLGTGCSIPKKLRNVSSILFDSPNFAILMDAGEDTLSQIHRFYGDLDVCKKISTIYISHSHSDHFFGVVKVIQKILEFKSSIVLVAPNIVKKFIDDFIKNGIIFHSTNVFGNRNYEHKIYNEKTHKYIFENHSITICPVYHNIDSCGAVIKVNEKTIAYSGDNRPSELFAKISYNADVMIHEASFEEDLKEEAIDRKHSTSNEAHEIFLKSKAKKLILTHFSQRYNTIPVVKEAISAFDFYRFEFD